MLRNSKFLFKEDARLNLKYLGNFRSFLTISNLAVVKAFQIKLIHKLNSIEFFL